MRRDGGPVFPAPANPGDPNGPNRGLSGNENASALISMMARSTTRSNQRPDTLMQDRNAPRSMKFSCNARPDHTFGSNPHSARRRTWSAAIGWSGSGQSRRFPMSAISSAIPGHAETLRARVLSAAPNRSRAEPDRIGLPRSRGPTRQAQKQYCYRRDRAMGMRLRALRNDGSLSLERRAGRTW